MDILRNFKTFSNISPFRFVLLLILSLLFFLSACETASTKPEKKEYGSVVAGVNLDSLFAEPAAAEIAAIRADWQSRGLSLNPIQIRDSLEYPVDSASLKIFILAQTIENFTHYSVAVLPISPSSEKIPLIIYCHGGDNGVTVDEVAGIALQLNQNSENYIVLAPSFRSEAVRYGDKEWISGGDSSPWNYDVDDALNLFHTCNQRFSVIDTTRTGLIGISRGGGVALLMSIREPSIDLVIDYFGPTNFFSNWVRELTGDILSGKAVDLPGMDYLSATYIQPLKNGKYGIAELRRQLLIRSPLYFHEQIPAVQIFHGTADEIVPVSQSEELIDRLETDNRAGSDFKYSLFEGFGHDQNTVIASLLALRIFISSHLY